MISSFGVKAADYCLKEECLEGIKRKKGKLTISRRYNQVPLLRSSPGGFRGSWPYRTYPAANIRDYFHPVNFFFIY
jgi:hypothetical protein